MLFNKPNYILSFQYIIYFLISVNPPVAVNCSYNKLDALISQIYFWRKTLHVSDSSSFHHQEFFTVHAATVYVIEICWQLSVNVYVLVCVQWKTPDGGQKNCQKHLEFYSKKQIWEISAPSWFYHKNLSRCTVDWTSIYESHSWQHMLCKHMHKKIAIIWLVFIVSCQRNRWIEVDAMGDVFTVNRSKFTLTFMDLAFLRGEMYCLFRGMGYSRESGMKIIIISLKQVPYILESNPHPNLIHTSFCRFLKRKKC